MKKAFVIVLLLCACTSAHQKPFVIVSKYPAAEGLWKFYYQAADGQIEEFKDTNKYSVGDTIK